MQNLEWQAVNLPNRYRHKTQKKLCIGDLVAVKCKLLKPFFYPKGVVTHIEYNDVHDINAVTIKKANGEKSGDTLVIFYCYYPLERRNPSWMNLPW